MFCGSQLSSQWRFQSPVRGAPLLKATDSLRDTDSVQSVHFENPLIRICTY